MKPSILITGISGFLGNVLINKLDLSVYNNVYILILEDKIPAHLKNIGKNIKILKGDITDHKVHELIPGNIEILLHMAAVTGKASEEVYDKVNFRAFRDLVRSMKEKDLKKVLFISTIAVKFSKRRRYFYSFSKEKAEHFLKGSGVKYSILRPTMILGSGSPVLKGFSMLSGLPLVPLFGGGKAIIQPVHIDDVCKSVIYILSNSLFNGGIFDIGGPDKLTVKDFLKKISQEKGKKARFIYIPMWMMVFLISILEKMVYSFLPITLGQLATFRNDSVAGDNIILKELSSDFVGIDKMVTDSVQSELKDYKNKEYLKECRVFTKYLIGRRSTEYNEKKYLEFLEKADIISLNKFDSLLSRIALISPLFTKICDGYSRFFFQHSILRKKLGTLFAILETSPESYRYIDDIGSKSIIMILISLGLRGMWFAFHLFFSIFFFLPLQIIFGRGKRKNPEGDKIG